MRGLVAGAVLALALCVTGIISERTSVSAQRRARAERWLERRDVRERRGARGERASGGGNATSTADLWLQLLSQYAKNETSSVFPLRPFPVDLPTIGADGRTTTLLVLPVPWLLPVHTNDGEYDANLNKHRDDMSFGRYDRLEGGRNRPELPKPDAAGGVVTSREMVAKFRAQAFLGQGLPPIVPIPSRESQFTAGLAPPPYPSAPPPPLAAPPKPQFKRSIILDGRLTVHRADFSENYTAWWDAGTGAARLVLHDGSTSTYRTVLTDGRIRLLEMGVDQTGERDVQRCDISAHYTSSDADLAHPALPDTEPFSFVGYGSDGQTEVWRHKVHARVGELGGARGESLVYTHELRVTRYPEGNFVVPHLYSVSVDSSVLGAECDGYTHVYNLVDQQDLDPTLFGVDIEAVCEEWRTLDISDPEHRARLEPLREFLMPRRDPRHDAGFDRFKEQFGRVYQDDIEEAVRKNLYVQNTRFVSSANRQRAKFELEINFLGDRLDSELDELLGVALTDDRDDAKDFPYSNSSLHTAGRDLPEEFDWRLLGAVSPVKNQDTCMSSWAFAVTGAVEGALFVRTRNLVELAEQCLVDCAHSHGAHGCNGTWPSHAYDYIRDEGLPARAAYPPYSNRVMRCRHPPVPAVTHISGHVNVKPYDVEALKVAIKNHAPSVIIVDAKAKSFIFYKKGVLQDERCLKYSMNHAILAVGWGQQRGEMHFIAKNTYSAAWGEAGYVRLHARSNTCGVLALPSYPVLRAPDPDRGDLSAAAAAGSTADDDR